MKFKIRQYLEDNHYIIQVKFENNEFKSMRELPLQAVIEYPYFSSYIKCYKVKPDWFVEGETEIAIKEATDWDDKYLINDKAIQ